MSKFVSDRDQRALLFGIAACSALVIALRGVPLLIGWTRATRASATQLQREVARARMSLARVGETGGALRARRARYNAVESGLLHGRTVAGAGGALASVLSRAASHAEVRLANVQLDADSTSGGTFTVIRARADFTGDIEGLTALVAELEVSSTLVRIRELSITQPSPADGDDRPEALNVDIVVDGIMAGPRSLRTP